MTKKFNWTTMSKYNVERTAHTWKFKLVGYPEFRDMEKLLAMLSYAGFTCRLVNHSRPKPGNCWILNPGYVDVFVERERCVRFVTYKTLEVLATRGEEVSIMVYLNR